MTKPSREKLPIIIAGMMLGKKYFCTSLAGCSKQITGFKDRESARAYKVDRLCQDCQDKIFNESYG